MLAFATPSFDASVLELCMSLPQGAALVVPTPGPLLGGELAEVLRTARITHTLLPPAALATLPPDTPGTLPDLKTLTVGADACSAELVARWAPHHRLVNSYGPTEATVVATWSGPLTADGGAPPIGRRLPDTGVYVLDARLRPVPDGVAGELWLSGPTLARPGLTASRFTADPFGPPGSRMYRTGDLARRDAHGELHYLGRTDCSTPWSRCARTSRGCRAWSPTCSPHPTPSGPPRRSCGRSPPAPCRGPWSPRRTSSSTASRSPRTARRTGPRCPRRHRTRRRRPATSPRAPPPRRPSPSCGRRSCRRWWAWRTTTSPWAATPCAPCSSPPGPTTRSA
nr:AMP-binding protein [Streptomyces sp. NRRL B-1347]